MRDTRGVSSCTKNWHIDVLFVHAPIIAGSRSACRQMTMTAMRPSSAKLAALWSPPASTNTLAMASASWFDARQRVCAVPCVVCCVLCHVCCVFVVAVCLFVCAYTLCEIGRKVCLCCVACACAYEWYKYLTAWIVLLSLLMLIRPPFPCRCASAWHHLGGWLDWGTSHCEYGIRIWHSGDPSRQQCVLLSLAGMITMHFLQILSHARTRTHVHTLGACLCAHTLVQEYNSKTRYFPKCLKFHSWVYKWVILCLAQ